MAEWRTGLERGAAAASDITSGLTDEQLLWSPPEGGWSIAQVLEHLAITNEQYIGVVREALPGARQGKPRAWRPSLAGRMLAYALENPRKARAPAAFKPGPTASVQSRGRFLKSVDDLVSELDRAADADLGARTHSPAARIIPLNLGDAFRLQVLHADRHIQQMRRIMQRPDFPA